MITVRDVIKIREIEKTLDKFDKCMVYYQYYENTYNFIKSLRQSYIMNDRLTESQLSWLDKYYNKIQEDRDNMEDECNAYSLGDF
jgi:hypothetical protein